MHVVQHWVNNLDTLGEQFGHKTSSSCQFKLLKSTCYSAALHVTMTCLDVKKRHMLECQMGDVIVQLLLNSPSLDLA